MQERTKNMGVSKEHAVARFAIIYLLDKLFADLKKSFPKRFMLDFNHVAAVKFLDAGEYEKAADSLKRLNNELESMDYDQESLMLDHIINLVKYVR